jgi:hypothetical protein
MSPDKTELESTPTVPERPLRRRRKFNWAAVFPDAPEDEAGASRRDAAENETDAPGAKS